MDFSFDTTHGLQGLVYSAIGLVLVKTLTDIIKGVWSFINRNKGPTKEQFETLMKELQVTQKAFTDFQGSSHKMSKDLHRCFLFLKVMAGEEWPKLRKKVEDIESEEKTF